MTNEEKRQQRGNAIVGIILAVMLAIGLAINFIF